MFPNLSHKPLLAVDTETTGLHWWKDKIFGFSVSDAENDWYFDIRREPKAVVWLGDTLRTCGRVVFHNAKFDWHFLREAGVDLNQCRSIICSMIRAALIDEHLMSYDLDSLGKKYLGAGKDREIWVDLAEMFGGPPTKNAQIKNLPRAPAELVGRYAKQDTRVCYDLAVWQDSQILSQDLERVHKLEFDLLPEIVHMERYGVRVNIDAAERALDQVERTTKKLQEDLNRQAGFAVNVNSPPDMKKLFKPEAKTGEDGKTYFEFKDGTRAKLTPGGAPSVDADSLRHMKSPEAETVLRIRKLTKTSGTFLRGHILSNHNNGVIHANFNQTRSDNDNGTTTGRLSVDSPALQQIPARDVEIAEVVRSIFIPDGLTYDWVCNDWAQMDFRVFAHYVDSPKITKIYNENPNADFHKIASELTGLPRSPRFAGDPNAKQINLGLVFGMGEGRLAQEMGLPYTIEQGRGDKTWVKPGPEAMEVFERYHSAIPGVKELLVRAGNVARSRGFVKTIMGRRIRFPRGMFTHKAGGLIFQGSAADALKVKIVETSRYLRSLNNGSRLLLNVHDEFDSNVPKGDEKTRAELNRIVTAFRVGDEVCFRVPIVTDQGVGDNWWDASK